MVKTKKVLTDVAKIITIGNAKGISLPSEWLKANKIELGDRVIYKVEKLKLKG